MPKALRYHRIETLLDGDPHEYKPFHLIHEPQVLVERGDRVIFFDIATKRSTTRDVADSQFVPILSNFRTLRLYLMHPEVNFLRQISITNQRDQTSVVWVGDSRALKVGRGLRIHDSFDEWHIAGTFTALAPYAVPIEARVVHVQEIEEDV